MLERDGEVIRQEMWGMVTSSFESLEGAGGAEYSEEAEDERDLMTMRSNAEITPALIIRFLTTYRNHRDDGCCE